MFTRAIVRPPVPNFSEGLTTAGLGAPDYEQALRQHKAYCRALERCGLALTCLDADPAHPDSTFVEDVAVITKVCVVITRPGAASRLGETSGLRPVFERFFPASSIYEIEAPGTLDGGDVCQAESHFFIGVSERTNQAGARQLAEVLGQVGCTSRLVDIAAVRSVPGAIATGSSLLHLKSGLAYLGDNRLLLTEGLADRPEFAGYELVGVQPREEYAANCVRVNDHVLMAAGFPILEKTIRRLGYQTIVLDMSEFQKMDGGLSCLSLRF